MAHLGPTKNLHAKTIFIRDFKVIWAVQSASSK
jgi:hypothetical protein